MVAITNIARLEGALSGLWGMALCSGNSARDLKINRSVTKNSGGNQLQREEPVEECPVTLQGEAKVFG
jgi:hypothetical protein